MLVAVAFGVDITQCTVEWLKFERSRVSKLSWVPLWVIAQWGFTLTTGNGLAGRALDRMQRKVKQIRTRQLTHSFLLT